MSDTTKCVCPWAFEALAAKDAEITQLRAALRNFVVCVYPVAKEINPRGYDWHPEKVLDNALDGALQVLSDEVRKDGWGQTSQ